MPLDPSIPLAAVGPQVQQYNPLQNAAQLAQLQQLFTQQQLARLQVTEAEQTAQERKAAREVFASIQQQGLDVNTPEGQKVLRSQLYPVAPNMAAALQKGFNDARRTEAAALKDEADAGQAQLKTVTDRLQAMDTILANTTPETFPQDRQRLIELGYKPEVFPPVYDQRVIEAARNRLIPLKDQAELAFKQKEQQERQNLEERKLGMEQTRTAVIPGPMGFVTHQPNLPGTPIAPVPGIPGAAQVAAITPAVSEMAKNAVALGTTTQTMALQLGQLERLRKEGIYEGVTGMPTIIDLYRKGGFTAELAKKGFDEAKLARTAAFLNIATGLPLGQVQSLSKTTDKDIELLQQAHGNLQRLQPGPLMDQALDDLRRVTSEKAALANEQLQQIQANPTTLPTFPVPEAKGAAKAGASTSQGKILTEADIQATMADPRNKGRTRAEIVAAAQAKGWSLR